MKRSPALVLAAALALVLAGCSGGPGGGQESPPTASSPTATMPQPTPGRDPGGQGEADPVGQWGGVTEGSPVLWFASGGHFNGNDGCNTLGGTWVANGERIELKDMTMTLVACLGMDTWLSSAAAVRVKGDTLHVTNADGQEIGTLGRLNVAY